MHYYKINNEIMQYSIFGNDIALIMHYRALFTMSGLNIGQYFLASVCNSQDYKYDDYDEYYDYNQTL